MKVLYLGGTGEISYPCLEQSATSTRECAVLNRGKTEEPLPPGVRQIVGDLADPNVYASLAREHFDVICQFRAYSLADIERDIAAFSGRTSQYIFISSASAYQKPPTTHLITEDIPLHNPYWPYSQAKADMEKRLLEAHGAGKLPVTIVRPSHTYRKRFPGTFVSGDINAWRMLNGRPIIVHGDGTALWTLTHATDFALPFMRLLGNARALGEAFHITSDFVYPWDRIIRTEAAALGVEPQIVHVPTDTLLRYNKDWAGPLLGDKAWSTLFDNTKIRLLVGVNPGTIPLDPGLRWAAPFVRQRVASMQPDHALHALLDRIAQEQLSLGLPPGRQEE